QFVNYTTADGLPHRIVSDLLETRDGVYLLGTADGLCVFNPAGWSPARAKAKQTNGGQGRPPAENAPPMFTVSRPAGVRPFYVTDLYEDRAGTIWIGSTKGLYRLDRGADQWRFSYIDLGVKMDFIDGNGVYSLLEDRRGALWVSTIVGLFRRLPDGRI